VTDVTGFALLGHAREMALGSGVSMKLNHATVAYLPGAVEAARGRNFSGGLSNNRDFLDGCVQFAPDVAEEFRGLFFDPQTSGGLLAAISPEAIDAAMAGFEGRKIPARVIGEVLAKRSPLIEVI
jgi:selenide, water dikinase